MKEKHWIEIFESKKVKIRTKSFHLRKANLEWIAQVAITSDWFFSCVSEYWNFSFAWRSFGDWDFREFLSKLNESYFWIKMYQGMAYVTHTKKVENACYRFADEILPTLREALKNDIEENPIF